MFIFDYFEYLSIRVIGEDYCSGGVCCWCYVHESDDVLDDGGDGGKYECQEKQEVVFADAFAHPWAVMVVTLYAHVAAIAVYCRMFCVDLAFSTEGEILLDALLPLVLASYSRVYEGHQQVADALGEVNEEGCILYLGRYWVGGYQIANHSKHGG